MADDEENKQVQDEEEEEEDEEDLEKLQAEIARMEQEAAKLTKETEELSKGGGGENSDAKSSSNAAAAAAGAAGGDNKPARDSCSVYVGQVDYSATPEELLKHFDACGTVERVTIVCDKFTGKPKGFAYIEFQNEEAVENALKLNDSEFKGRNLKVTHKRVNQPAFIRGGPAVRGGRGRGGRGFRGGYRGRGRGQGYRGGGRGGYHPYY